MQIAVDAHAIGQRLTGNEVYVRSLLEEYARLEQDIEFLTYISVPEATEQIPRGFRRRYVSRNPFVRLGAELSAKLREYKTDLIHVQYTAPLSCPVPIVATVHDVSFLEHPEYFPALRAAQLRLSTWHTLKRAAKVITISEFSRRCISTAFDLDLDNIAVTPLAAQDCFQPMNRAHAIRKVSERLGIRQPFVLNVGDLHPRKNQIGLIRAFKELVTTYPQLPHVLVLAGKRAWFAPRVIEEAKRSGLAERIIMTGFVNDEVLPALYNAADLFVFPSFYEGFGLPAIEAMACGRPVACSNATALPEVVDGAAVLFDPASVGEQMRAMRDILLDQEFSRRQEKKSLQRAACFGWEETARKTLDVYYAVADQHPSFERRKELVAP